MILYKNKNCKIEAIKQNNGLFCIVQKIKNIFGRGFDSCVLRENLQKKDILTIKNKMEDLRC